MINSVINSWDSRKTILEEWFKQGVGIDDYESIVKKIVEIFLQDLDDHHYRKKYNKVHVIDDGDYQGDLCFLIAPDCYQPDISNYIITNQYYGSCSGCDLLQGILNYTNEKPNEEQVNKLMTLSLHLIQRMKFVGDFE